jgi:heme o synthase
MATDTILAPSAVSIAQRSSIAGSAVLSDYWAITKPEVNFLIVMTTAAGFYIGSPPVLSDVPWIRLLHTLLGTVLVASGAAALNQWMEHDFDAKMQRTARRPIVTGRIEPVHALMFGTLMSLAGTVYLAVAASILASLLAVGTLLGYLFLYTPCKRITPLCTLIGAVPGAVPPLIGWAAARGRLDPPAWALFALVFLWQFPHFMAIAWMYRDDYDRAGYMVLPHGHARERFVTWQTLVPLSALPLFSLLAALSGGASIVSCTLAPLLGLGFFHYGAQFALRKSGAAARQLLVASIVYLPLLFALLLIARA